MIRTLLVALAVLVSVVAAEASDLASAPLPTLALDPQPPTSIWNGLYVGTEISAVSSRGFLGKGARGGFGAAVTIGYDHAFANNIVLGVQASAGYVPLAFPFGRARGYDFAAADVRIGYDMGRLMPYVTSGLVLARPTGDAGPGLGSIGADSLNGLFNSPADLKAAGRIGAGVDYALTSNLHVGVSVSVSRDQGLLTP